MWEAAEAEARIRAGLELLLLQVQEAPQPPPACPASTQMASVEELAVGEVVAVALD